MYRAMSQATRSVTIVIVSRAGEVLGQLEPFTVGTPWWQDLEPILAVHPELVILRLLSVSGAGGRSMGGEVVYLAEPREEGWRRTASRLGPFRGESAWLSDHPLRMPWARPGGPEEDLEWAAAHVRITGSPRQVRSWNLSSIWRIPTEEGAWWLKCVPPFFAHEARVLELLNAGAARASAPRLRASAGHRMLLDDMSGRDGYDASLAEYEDILAALVNLQRDVAGVALTSDVPDWRGGALRRGAAEVVERRWPSATGLRRLLEGWEERFAAIEECGIADGLFHGDPHPGNARIDVHPPIIYDWGDSGWGHPLLDLAVLERYAPEEAGRLRRHWLRLWENAVPGSDPGRAWRLLGPAAVLRGAVVFQRFLDHIEPSERVYHDRDVDPFLTAAEQMMATT